MKKKLLIGMTVILLALLVGCPQETKNSVKPPVIPDVLVKAISVAGVDITPLPAPAESIEEAQAVSVVVNTERPPSDNEDPNKIWYKPAQPIAVTLADANQTVFYESTRPGEEPYDIVLPHTEKNKNVFTRNIGITLPNDDGFQVGQVVWLKVVSVDESKTEYYKINVVNQTHDTAINSFKIRGYDVLNPNQSGHIGPWITGATWADAVNGLVNLKQTEVSNVVIALTPRNNLSDLSKPKFEYATTTATATAEPADWSEDSPTTFAVNNVLAVKVTASNGTNIGYMKVAINVGGSSFLTSLKVNNKSISLGNPSMDINNVGGAYRVEEGQSLTGSGITWAVAPVAADTNATITWALVAKGTVPQTADFTKPTSFDTSHNYLYIKVVSQNGSTTMYYLVVFDERPKDTEHIKTGKKCVPMYRFTIPAGKTWGDLGTYPKIRIKILQEESEFNQSDGYQRNFTFGEVSKMVNDPTLPAGGDNPRLGASEYSSDTLSIRTGGSTFNIFMPFYINKQAKAWAADIPDNVAAPDVWYVIEYPLHTSDSWRAPWDPNAGTKPAIINDYRREDYWPSNSTTGDVLFGIGITHDATREYWVKELSLVSEDGKLIIPCDLLGNGRIDSETQEIGFVRVEAAGDGVEFLRELVADPTLK